MAAKRLTCYLFIGAPGVGKGTFSKIVKKNLGFAHFAIGDVIRAEINDPSSKFGPLFQSYVKKGELIPDELVNKFAIDRVKSATTPLIMDGFPRTIEQAKILDKELAGGDHDIVAVNIVLDRDVTTEKLLSRVLCKTCKDEYNTAHICTGEYNMPALLPEPQKCKLGPEKCNFVGEKRVDDTPETIKKRFDEYDAKTNPLIDYYTKQSKIKTFNVKKGAGDGPEFIQMLLTPLK